METIDRKLVFEAPPAPEPEDEGTNFIFGLIMVWAILCGFVWGSYLLDWIDAHLAALITGGWSFVVAVAIWKVIFPSNYGFLNGPAGPIPRFKHMIGGVLFDTEDALLLYHSQFKAYTDRSIDLSFRPSYFDYGTAYVSVWIGKETQRVYWYAYVLTNSGIRENKLIELDSPYVLAEMVMNVFGPEKAEELQGMELVFNGTPFIIDYNIDMAEAFRAKVFHRVQAEAIK